MSMNQSTPSGAPAPEPSPQSIEAALREMGLLQRGEPVRWQALAGGVSSDIWRVDAASGAYCVKRALPRLRVAAEWRAPVERNAFEVAWMRVAAGVVPDAVPRLRGHDSQRGLFVMDYLAPEHYPNWKSLLAAGRADVDVAAAVGDRLGRLHAATARDGAVAERFASDAIFHAIRLEPYLGATALVHPDRADALEALLETTARTKLALVHGDVSPKNILIGPNGPVFLDAECAWYGDPAFDLAFCLNHLLLKCLWVPRAAAGFLACFDALSAAYLAHVAWEPPAALEARCARLLPGLLLARVDGKSPVEYLGSEGQAHVRRVARAWLGAPHGELPALRRAWAEGLAP